MFKNKILLITGGTGSFGNAVLNRFLKSDIKEIRVFSRDEKKQDEMRRSIKSKKIKYFIGDVRDLQSVNNAMTGVDYVFHAAALKQVPSCEFYPIEAVKTNILGTENVLISAINNKIKKVICLSTDKAVYPINAMGVSKAMMEKVFVAKSRFSKNTIIVGTRYGNVMASRGSVIPLFHSQVTQNKPVTLTDPNMTRFMMTLDDAVDLVLFAFEKGKSGDIFVQKSPSTTMLTLAQTLIKVYKSKSKIKNIGIRHGEKIHETLLSKEESSKSQDLGKYFRIPSDNRDLNYDKYFIEGQDIKLKTEFNSKSTKSLSESQLIKLLNSIGYHTNGKKK